MKHLRPSSHREAQLREAGDDDLEKLFSLFAASREDLLAAISTWDETQQKTFMHLQFEAQRDQYRRQYPDAHWDVIIRQGEIIGQILVARADGFRLVDLSLLPEFRNLGIGSSLLQGLLDEAEGSGRRVTLHVLQNNPAIHLYQRLGFSDAGEQGIYRRMEWVPTCGA